MVTLSIVALVVSGLSVVFVLMQTLLMSRSNRTTAAAAELTFNLAVMVQLQDVLLEIAKSPESYAHVWGEPGTETFASPLPRVAGQGLIDMVCMSLKACKQLPNFSENAEQDWKLYAALVMDACPALRQEVLDAPGWWPEVLE